MTDSNSAYTVREVFAVAELERVCQVEQLVWGPNEKVDNADLFRAIQDEGGLIMAAEAVDGEFVGMLFGFPTRDPLVQHSHRMGVLHSWRGRGVAEALKLAQREWCLAHEITRVRWTFDPLRRTNARLNMIRLGATANRFFEDHYGEEETDGVMVLTDRVMADWDLLRVVRPVVLDPELVPIPDNIIALRHADPRAALAWQRRYRSALPDLFAQGLSIVDVVDTPGGETACAYALIPL